MIGCGNYQFLMTSCRNGRFVLEIGISIHIAVRWLIMCGGLLFQFIFDHALNVDGLTPLYVL